VDEYQNCDSTISKLIITNIVQDKTLYKTRAQQLLRWATIWPQQTWAEKLGGAGVGALGHHLTHWGLGQGLSLYQVASWSTQPFGHSCRNATLLRI